MVVFGRRWGIASDDLVFPGSVELFVRVLWYVSSCLLTDVSFYSSFISLIAVITVYDFCFVPCYCYRWIGTLILYAHHKQGFDCNGRILHSYLVGLLVVLGLIILTLTAIVYVSAQGK